MRVCLGRTRTACHVAALKAATLKPVRSVPNQGPDRDVPSMSTRETRPIIILAEEEPDEARAIVGYLETAGFVVAAVETTDEALRRLEATPDAAGLVTDAHVPGTLDGWELAERARALRPGLALVLMSGHSDATSGPLPQGAAFVLKPNVPANLAATLRDLIERA